MTTGGRKNHPRHGGAKLKAAPRVKKAERQPSELRLR
jgi:hypothetical protein